MDLIDDPIPPDGFQQEPPQLGDPYREDALLRSVLRRLLGDDLLHAVEPALERMSALATREIRAWGDEAEAHPPVHVPYDPWGRRIDRVETARGWRRLHDLSAREGLVALAYERPWGARSRIVQHALLYLFHPSAATYLCPLAMTDGAAHLLETTPEAAEPRRRALERLTSRDPERFWTSGQWMTELSGGSDVATTETVARQVAGDPGWALWGTKWFTSAVDSDVALTLARPEGAASGSRGLALYYLELRRDDGSLQGIRIRRLKDKLGTRALPTAELELAGVPAWTIGETGEGVRRIADMMNVTRIYNTNAAVSAMRRAVALAEDYAGRRMAFGRRLADQPLHRRTLDDLHAEVAVGLVLLFRAVELQGRTQTGEASADEGAVLRLVTPLVKLYTGRQAVAVTSEALECFGGVGYVEDSGIPRLLRDAQVLPIWEGTTNVLSLDALRAVAREGALDPFLEDLEERLRRVSEADLAAGSRRWIERLPALRDSVLRAAEKEPEAARRVAFDLTRGLAASLLLEQIEWARASDPATMAPWRRALDHLERLV
jgi:alkylation response protein AidB-like acyl-CoA dehydrogenase